MRERDREQRDEADTNEAFWQEMLAMLRAAGRGHDHDDDVQETLLSLLSESDRELDDLHRMRWLVLRRRRIDRFRAMVRRRWLPLGPVDPAADEPARNCLADALLRESDLVESLGGRALDLLLIILCDGVRDTHAIARRHGVARSTARVRRERVCRILAEYRDLLADGGDRADEG